MKKKKKLQSFHGRTMDATWGRRVIKLMEITSNKKNYSNESNRIYHQLGGMIDV